MGGLTVPHYCMNLSENQGLANLMLHKRACDCEFFTG